MTWQNVTFYTPRQSDRRIIEMAEQTFTAAGVGLDAVSIVPVCGGGTIEAPPTHIRENAEVNEILSADTHLVRTFAFRFAKGGVGLSVTRPDQPLRDQVTLEFAGPNNSNPQRVSREQVLRLT